MKSRSQVIVLVFLLTALVGALVYLRRDETAPPPASTTQFVDPANGVSFAYPTHYTPGPISDQLTESGTIFRATDGSHAILTVRHETGLGVLRLGGGTVFDALTSNAERQLPRRFPGYGKQSATERTVGAEKAYALEFTYTGTDGTTTIRQAQVMVVVRDNDGYFITLQAPDAEFDRRRTDLNTLLDSVTFTTPVK